MLLITGFCKKCQGTAYFSKMSGTPAFCPMCGEDAKNNWTQGPVDEIPMKDTFELHVRNDNPRLAVDFCIGDREYTLVPDELITIEANDGDCVYFDAIYEDMPEVE